MHLSITAEELIHKVLLVKTVAKIVGFVFSDSRRRMLFDNDMVTYSQSLTKCILLQIVDDQKQKKQRKLPIPLRIKTAIPDD